MGAVVSLLAFIPILYFLVGLWIYTTFLQPKNPEVKENYSYEGVLDRQRFDDLTKHPLTRESEGCGHSSHNSPSDCIQEDPNIKYSRPKYRTEVIIDRDKMDSFYPNGRIGDNHFSGYNGEPHILNA